MVDKFETTGVANQHPYRVPTLVAIGFIAFLFFVSDCFKYCS